MPLFQSIFCRILTVILVGAASCGWAAEPSGRVVALLSHSAPPYELALEGFKAALAEAGMSSKIEVMRLEGDPQKASAAVARVGKEGASLIVALGSLATASACREITGPPLVAGMILAIDDLRKHPNATGVVLNFPVETHLTWMTKILPGLQDVGVMFNPDRNAVTVEAAQRLARGMGLQLWSQPVEKPEELPRALDFISKHAAVLWGISDDLVLTSQTAKPILLFSFRNNIPLVGPSEHWVKSGAIYSLDCDYEDVGRQCGELAGKLLRGAKAASLPVAGPRKVLFSVNLGTAQQMKIQIPEAMLKQAQRVYQ